MASLAKRIALNRWRSMVAGFGTQRRNAPHKAQRSAE
jgi:hypothetical protein